MNRFSYARPTTVAEALSEVRGEAVRFLAGGTNLVDLMREEVERPVKLVDINRLPLRDIEETEGGGLKIGALVPNSDLAWDARIESRYPLLSAALLAGASPQLRNAATTGGNLLQRTRCYYFYDVATACNKRDPGSGCQAIGGLTRLHAILGASEHCIATHPSDMCVALQALDARVHVEGPEGARAIAFQDFHRLPGDRPQDDTTLRPGELVTAIELPAERFDMHYTYLKLRDRQSYAFALVSVAAALRMEDDVIGEVRLALGGVAHKPWRNREAEALLVGKAPSADAYAEVADAILAEARGQGTNDFKIPLARRAILRALDQAANANPQSQIEKRIA
ncbi:FAD binding domain-containing protein [Sphingosinithalassobacter sp. CS137]|uniref:FAD binding domain-containing protein n=1 Tax=Sphingosinithalassobacter sp. CS137 TaxID=2762748 RepID=UPI00165DC399|nr:xanthine dehydrogenase family protein subunit M [Sphingosinithalassobacter sp. CS137]